jgi:hypothetical protein
VVELTKGKWAKVDLTDMEKVMFHCWYLCSAGYAYRWQAKRRIYMHRLILGLPPGREPGVDHRNRDRLDNRRSNLRTATRSQQGVNAPKHPGSSGLRGVSWDKRKRKWRADIRTNGKKRTLGYFDDRVAASRAYDWAALEAYGEFSILNGA